VAGHSALSATELVRRVGDSVTAWTTGAEQSDDITMLAVRYLGAAQQ
jgi:serine phosphatase RsbU (regulator of sigma subunit)